MEQPTHHSRWARALLLATAIGAIAMAFPSAGADDGSLLVGSFEGSRVFRYNATTGAFIDEFVPEGSGGLSGACCLAFGPDENLYVGSILTASVLRYNGATGESLGTFVSPGSGGLVLPVGVAFGPDGNLYIGDIPTNSILRYDGETGDFIDAFVPTGGGGLFGPRMLVFKEKISMCHRPPGNPSRARTVDVGHLSAADHAAHGDSVGPCAAGASRGFGRSVKRANRPGW
jgi:WD40 repeat protein